MEPFTRRKRTSIGNVLYWWHLAPTAANLNFTFRLLLQLLYMQWMYASTSRDSAKDSNFMMHILL